MSERWEHQDCKDCNAAVAWNWQDARIKELESELSEVREWREAGTERLRDRDARITVLEASLHRYVACWQSGGNLGKLIHDIEGALAGKEAKGE